MITDSPNIPLSEQDYLSILDIVTRFHECRTRKDMRKVFNDQILPLFEAQSGIYGGVNVDIASKTLSNVHVLDCVGIIEEKDYQQLADSLPFLESIPRVMQSLARPVLAVDIDIPREEFHKEISTFFEAFPKYQDNQAEITLNPVQNFIMTYSRPELTFGIGIHRHAPHDKPFDLRDIRLLELIRPHVLNTIKTITMNEQLAEYRSVVEALADTPVSENEVFHTGVALVSSTGYQDFQDMRVVFCNQAFKDLVRIEHGQKLPRDLILLLEKEVSQYNPPFKADFSAVELPFYHLAQGFFRLSINLLDSTGSDKGPRWLLRMKHASDAYSKLNLAMQNAELTEQEMEVACLVRDGFGPVAIAARLFLSPQEVKAHLELICQKFGVHSQEELVAKLKQVEA